MVVEALVDRIVDASDVAYVFAFRKEVGVAGPPNFVPIDPSVEQKERAGGRFIGVKRAIVRPKTSRFYIPAHKPSDFTESIASRQTKKNMIKRDVFLSGDL